MKKVFISINGVLRDTISKYSAEYRKYYIETELEEDSNDDFEYDMVLPVTSQDLLSHYKFQDEKEFDYFRFIEFAIEIFGHAAPVYSGVFKDLAEINQEKEDWEITIVSDEKAKGKPASLFFLSKNSCYVNNYKFYNTEDAANMWSNCDLWVTSDTNIINSKPEDKEVVMVEYTTNVDVECENTIKQLGELKSLELWKMST
jgi:hypothetical protein